MKILALDTSSSSGSIAIFDDNKLVFSSYLDIRVTHSERLMPMIDHSLKMSKINKSELNAIALVNGPGSFTGIRIGLATAKGIAYGLEIPIIPFYSNEVLALNAYKCNKNILAIIDARMKEIYAAIYDENLNEIVAPHNSTPEEFSKLLDGDYFVVGDGYSAYEERFDYPKEKLTFGLNSQNIISAEKIMDLIKLRNINPEFNLQFMSDLEPFYLRKSQAEIVKEQKEAK